MRLMGNSTNVQNRPPFLQVNLFKDKTALPADSWQFPPGCGIAEFHVFLHV